MDESGACVELTIEADCGVAVTTMVLVEVELIWTIGVGIEYDEVLVVDGE